MFYKMFLAVVDEKLCPDLFGSAFRSCQSVNGCFVKPWRWNDHCKHFMSPLYRAGGAWNLHSSLRFSWDLLVICKLWDRIWAWNDDLCFGHLCLFLALFFPNPRVKPKSWSWRTFGPRIMPATHARCLSAMSAVSLTNPSPSSSQTPQVRRDMRGPWSPLMLHLLNSHYSSRRIRQHSVQGLQHLDLFYGAAGITGPSHASLVARAALVSLVSCSHCIGQTCHEIIKTDYM